MPYYVSVKKYIDDILGGLASATPLVAASTAGMTDTTRLYINTGDGYVYYYDGANWTSTGILYLGDALTDSDVAALSITDPGNLYTAETVGGQLQEVKALANGKAEADALENYALWKTASTSNPVTVYPAPNSPMYPRISGAYAQSGTGTPSPDNIRLITPWVTSGSSINIAITGGNDIDITAPQAIATGWMNNEGVGQVTYHYVELGGSTTIAYSSEKTTTMLFTVSHPLTTTNNPTSICSHLARIYSSDDSEHFYVATDTIVIYINKARLSAPTVAGIKAYLGAQKTAGTPMSFAISNTYSVAPTISALVSLSQSDRATPIQNIVTSTPSTSITLTYAKSPIQESIDVATAIAAL